MRLEKAAKLFLYLGRYLIRKKKKRSQNRFRFQVQVRLGLFSVTSFTCCQFNNGRQKSSATKIRLCTVCGGIVKKKKTRSIIQDAQCNI